jgi:glycosyltransferase involved in cell wall biosynthesis/ribosomal protein S18 acetylase RimI-like enzyme
MWHGGPVLRIAHLTTIDLSLRYLLLAQLDAVTTLGGQAVGISAPGPYVAELEERGIVHIDLPHSTRGVDPFADIRAALALRRILKELRPDVLHTHTPKPGVYGRIVGRLVGVPVVMNTIHGLYATEEDRFAKRAFVYTLEAIASRFSDAELVQSAEDYELVRRRRITRPDRTHLLGNGVDLTRFDPDRISAERRTELRTSIGATSDTVVIGSVGRLVAEKGFPELFEAARDLGSDAILVIIGPHEPEKEDGLDVGIIREAEANGVRFLGMQENVDEWYAAMDVFVLASHREGFPRAAMEAAAMGRPVIATDIRGCREVVDDGITGMLVPKLDPAALRSAMNALIGDPDTRVSMGRAAHDKSKVSFDERRIVSRVLERQITLLREKGPRPNLAGSSEGEIEFRPARREDVRLIARLHIDGIDTGFLPTLGVRFLTHLYRAMIEQSGSRIIVAADAYSPIGFVAGVPDVGDFYKVFMWRHGLRAALSAIPALVKPSTWRRVWETARYDGDHHDAPAELLSMAVDPAYRGRGLGRRLANEFLDSLRADGIDRVKVVVAEANVVARQTYRSVGFEDLDTVEVHRGETSMVMMSGST